MHQGFKYYENRLGLTACYWSIPGLGATGIRMCIFWLSDVQTVQFK